jgi:S1-C subfamily serine protease
MPGPGAAPWLVPETIDNWGTSMFASIRGLSRRSGHFRRFAFLLLAHLCASTGSATAAGYLSIDSGGIDVGRGWRVGFTQWGAGCVAAARYNDGTTVWMGFSAKFGRFIAFTNPAWKSIEVGSQYQIQMRGNGTREWRGLYTGFQRGGDEKGIISGSLKQEVLEDFARASGFVVSLAERRLVGVELSGSRNALVRTLDCFRQNQDQAQRYAKADEGKKAPAPARRGASSGTGFFVSSDGHVLTNHHVVEGCGAIQVNRVGSLAEPAKLLASDGKNDLALLKTSLKPESVPGFRNWVRIGETVSVFGFPLSSLLATTGNFTVGNVTASAGLQDDTRMYQISAPVQPGNSGGPLVDENGNVIGVIVSKLNALFAMELTKDIPQNVNFAIKSTIAQNFLESNGMALTQTPSSAKLDQAEIARLSRGFTVRIRCEAK